MTLYHVNGKKRWLRRAQQVADNMLKQFARPDGVLVSSWDATDLVVAPPEQGDQVKPSGQSAAIALLLDLANTGKDQSTKYKQYGVAAYRALLPLYAKVNANPWGWGTLLSALSEPGSLKILETAASSDDVINALAPLDSADYVHARGYWVSSAGASELSLTVKVDTGYHINANPASDSFLIPTQLLLDGHENVVVEYPQSKMFKAAFAPNGIEVYEGRFVLNAQLPEVTETDFPAVQLRIQACNDEVCLAPTTISVPVSQQTHD